MVVGERRSYLAAEGTLRGYLVRGWRHVVVLKVSKEKLVILLLLATHLVQAIHAVGDARADEAGQHDGQNDVESE